jgi:hypothetical protein
VCARCFMHLVVIIIIVVVVVVVVDIDDVHFAAPIIPLLRKVNIPTNM